MNYYTIEAFLNLMMYMMYSASLAVQSSGAEGKLELYTRILFIIRLYIVTHNGISRAYIYTYASVGQMVFRLNGANNMYS